MAEITAAAVKDLRERSGAGMMDCKKALAETERRHGGGESTGCAPRAWPPLPRSPAAYRRRGPGRHDAVDGHTAARLVEVNAETDFVAKNEQFQDFVRDGRDLALGRPGATASRR